jgi:hypothetical protein
MVGPNLGIEGPKFRIPRLGGHNLGIEGPKLGIEGPNLGFEGPNFRIQRFRGSGPPLNNLLSYDFRGENHSVVPKLRGSEVHRPTSK